MTSICGQARSTEMNVGPNKMRATSNVPTGKFTKSEGRWDKHKLEGFAGGEGKLNPFLAELEAKCHFVPARTNGKDLIMTKVTSLDTVAGRGTAKRHAGALAETLKHAVNNIAKKGLMYLDFKPHNIGCIEEGKNVTFYLIDHDALQDITGELDQDNTAQTPAVFCASLFLENLKGQHRMQLYKGLMTHNIATAYWGALNQNFFAAELGFHDTGLPGHYFSGTNKFDRQHLTIVLNAFRDAAKDYFKTAEDKKLFDLLVPSYNKATKQIVDVLRNQNVEGSFTDFAAVHHKAIPMPR